MCPFLLASLFSIESLGHLPRVLRHSFNCSITRIFLHGLHPPDHSCRSSKSISLKDHRREGEKHTGLEESHEDGEGNNHGSSHNGFRCALLPRTMTFSSWASWTAHSNSIRNGKSTCFHPFSAIPHPSLLTDRYSRHSAYRSSKNQQPRLLLSLTLSAAVRASSSSSSSSSSSVWAWQWNQCCRLIFFPPSLATKATDLLLFFTSDSKTESVRSNQKSCMKVLTVVYFQRTWSQTWSLYFAIPLMLSRFLHRKTGFPLAFKTRSVAGCSRQILPLVFSSHSTPDPWLAVPDTDSSADFLLAFKTRSVVGWSGYKTNSRQGFPTDRRTSKELCMWP